MPIDMSHPYGQLLATLSRRQLLDIAWKLGAVAALPMTTRLAWAQPVFSTIRSRLASRPAIRGPTSVVLWTRLAPEPFDGGGMPMANVEVSWQVATDRTFRNIIRSGTAIARPELGHSVHVEADGLAPGPRILLSLPLRRRDQPDWPDRHRAGARRARSIGCALACAAADTIETGYFTGYGRLAEEQFDFVFHTGDYIYEGRGDVIAIPNNVRQHLGQEIYTLVDYRNRYAQYKSDPDLMAAHLSAPFIMAWDDHEVDNDYAGDRDERDTPPEIFLLRRAAAYQAYYESMPLRASMIPGGCPPAAVSAAAVRQPDRLQRARYAAISIEAGARAAIRMHARNCSTCGARSSARHRRQWLFDNLSESGGAWTVLGQQVPTFARDMASANPASRYSVDKWDGYVGLAQAAVRPPPRRQGRRTRSSCPATCTRTGAPISRPTSRNPSSADHRRRVHQFVDDLRRRRLRCAAGLGSSSGATTRTSRITATGAATCRARRHPRRCGRIFA